MNTDSSEEIFNRYATNDKQARPKKFKRKILAMKRKKYKDSQNIAKRHIMDMAPASVYIFNFFLFSSLGSLMPFLPVFFRLLGFSSLQNGLLFAVRPLISFWWGPLSSSFVTSSRYRKLFLFIFVAGTVASTFCLSVIRANDGWILTDPSCNHYAQPHRAYNRNVISTQDFTLAEFQQQTSINESMISQTQVSAYNDTETHSWKIYLKNAGGKIFRQLKKGMIMKSLFMSVLALTIVSEVFLGPTLHITQASIKFTSRQPVINSQCLNRVFCKIGMAVASVSITYAAWRYQCIFKNVHYFYFHFYGFLATGCFTAIISLALPTARPQRASFVTLVCNHVLCLVFNWDNFGYIFGLWIAGLSEGAINAYLLWYATENGASEIIIGVLVCLAIVTDMVLHFTVGMSMKWIGHIGLLSVGILLLSIQFFIIANVTNPYYIVPTQLLFGLAGCCIKSSFIGGTNSNGTKEMEKILFFIFQAAYMGLGLGLGGVFVSLPYFVFGAQKTFSALAVLTASYSLTSVLIQLVLYKRRRNTDHLDKQMYTKLNSYEPNSDWLVDAMVEEEKQSVDGVKEKDEVEETASKVIQHDTETANNNKEHIELNVLAIS